MDEIRAHERRAVVDPGTDRAGSAHHVEGIPICDTVPQAVDLERIIQLVEQRPAGNLTATALAHIGRTNEEQFHVRSHLMEIVELFRDRAHVLGYPAPGRNARHRVGAEFQDDEARPHLPETFYEYGLVDLGEYVSGASA